MARDCQSCSKCQNPLSDFEKTIGKALGADKVYCKSCTKKLEDEWTDLSFKNAEDKATPEEIKRFEELDKFLGSLVNAGYYGSVTPSTCPRCGREGLERMGEGSFMRTRCISCGYDDITDGSQ